MRHDFVFKKNYLGAYWEIIDLIETRRDACNRVTDKTASLSSAPNALCSPTA
jgi:hypothetical protein